MDFVDSNPLYESSVSADVFDAMGVFLFDVRAFFDTWLKAQLTVPVYW